MSREEGARTLTRVRVLQGALLLVIILAGLRLVKESAPSEVVLFTGVEASAEYAYGKRYAAFLEARGLRATLVETAGSSDNLERLQNEQRPAVAFALSGVERAASGGGESRRELVALASVWIEPAWLFMKGGRTIGELREADSDPVRLAIPGSGASSLADLLMQAHPEPDRVVIVPIDDAPSGGIDSSVERMDLDGVFALGTVHSELIDNLMASKRLAPVAVDRAPALARNYPFLIDVTLPEGSYDLARNLPGQDLSLLAPTIQLVARDDIPAAIVDLLLEAAREIHREPTFFSERGQYPSIKHVSLPVDPAAVRFFEDGPPRLRKILPFWASTLVDRFATFIATVLGAAVAIFSVLPRLLALPLQLKLHTWFATLVSIEKESMAGADVDAQIERLEALDRESVDVRVFRFQQTEYLEYRQQIYDTRDRLRLRQREAEPDPAS